VREVTSEPSGLAGLRRDLDRRWIALVLLAWAVYAAYALWSNWNGVRWLSLGDTDDNMRLMQVRALLAGQDWFDLRQYRLNPPQGFDIHWSRVVDLPLAGLILLFRPFMSPSWAERLACGVAPLLPLSIAMLSLAATVRRLIHPLAWPLAIAILVCAVAPMQMFAPERIDHHGWQLAMLALTLAGLTDPRAVRGGATVGLASAVSLSIGLEMLPYCAMAGGILALRWVWDRAESLRLQAYAAALGGGSALGFTLFASYANRVPRCDALTPVWLSVAVAGGGALLLLARLNPRARSVRLALAAAAAITLALFFALAFPQCLGRPEQVSDELARNWLGNVKEARPIWTHPFRLAFPVAVLPVIGLIGAGLAERRARGTERWPHWLATALFAGFAALMLLWQMRAGPAAALLAVPGATALGALLLPLAHDHRSAFVRVAGTVGAFLLVTGLFSWWVIKYLPVAAPSPARARVNAATGDCMRTSRLLTLNRYPRARVFTMVDLGPRLITVTHHDAIAGPYHRNGDAILDVQHAFGRAPDAARAIIKGHGATMLLVCPNMAEGTIYRARDRGGFYDRLAHGEQFPWLKPLPLPRRSPYRLFRVS
jgi:hypothetical protein